MCVCVCVCTSVYQGYEIASQGNQYIKSKLGIRRDIVCNNDRNVISFHDVMSFKIWSDV